MKRNTGVSQPETSLLTLVRLDWQAQRASPLSSPSEKLIFRPQQQEGPSSGNRTQFEDKQTQVQSSGHSFPLANCVSLSKRCPPTPLVLSAFLWGAGLLAPCYYNVCDLVVSDTLSGLRNPGGILWSGDDAQNLLLMRWVLCHWAPASVPPLFLLDRFPLPWKSVKVTHLPWAPFLCTTHDPVRARGLEVLDLHPEGLSEGYSDPSLLWSWGPKDLWVIVYLWTRFLILCHQQRPLLF